MCGRLLVACGGGARAFRSQDPPVVAPRRSGRSGGEARAGAEGDDEGEEQSRGEGGTSHGCGYLLLQPQPSYTNRGACQQGEKKQLAASRRAPPFIAS